MSRNKILLIDDAAQIRLVLRNFLEAKGFEILEAESVKAGIEALRDAHPDAAVLDYELQDGTAMEVLTAASGMDLQVPIVVLTGHSTIEVAVNAIKNGAEQFLTKPVELPALLVVIERMLENQRNRQRARADSGAPRGALDPFLGKSPGVQKLRETAERILATSTPILILGETGSGKGVLARWLHDHGPRAKEAFVDINCAGLSREFLDSELFGHEKGAFTGAHAAKQGLLEVAHRGTLFLDEIGDVDASVQPKLLKVLEERRFRRMGDVRDRTADVQLVAATHQALQQHVQSGQFRADLYYRLAALPLTIPPLRERLEDIPVLAEEITSHLSAQLGLKSPLRLAPGALTALRSYGWPGNLRELRNALERAALLRRGDVLEASDFALAAAEAPRPNGAMSLVTEALTLNELERRYIDLVLKEEGGKVEIAAKRLGIPRSSLYYKIKKMGLMS